MEKFSERCREEVKFEVERRRKKREDDLGCRWREEEGKEGRRQKEGKDFWKVADERTGSFLREKKGVGGSFKKSQKINE